MAVGKKYARQATNLLDWFNYVSAILIVLDFGCADITVREPMSEYFRRSRGGGGVDVNSCVIKHPCTNNDSVITLTVLYTNTYVI